MSKFSDDFDSRVESLKKSKIYNDYGSKVEEKMDGLYRSRYHGKLLGVCAGLAKKYDFPVTLVRTAFVLFTIFSAFWLGIIAYIALGLFMKLEPIFPLDAYQEAQKSKNSKLQKIIERSEKLAKRVENLEHNISKEDSWEQRLKQGQSN